MPWEVCEFVRGGRIGGSPAVEAPLRTRPASMAYGICLHFMSFGPEAGVRREIGASPVSQVGRRSARYRIVGAGPASRKKARTPRPTYSFPADGKKVRKPRRLPENGSLRCNEPDVGGGARPLLVGVSNRFDETGRETHQKNVPGEIYRADDR